MTIAAIPSPSTAVWHLGPIPIRAYALCILLGIVVACVVTEVRLRRRGAPPWAVLDIAVWAVPAGMIGARIYHVITSPDKYFGPQGDLVNVFKIWEGGIGIWGAVAGGALGAWVAARQLGIPLTMVADALAPGMPLAQAVGRFGNWFNNELYGGPTTLPWGLRVRGETDLRHPTFLYEALWNVGVAGLVLYADRRWKLGRGRAFALYVMGYTAGRFWIEMLRTDQAQHVFGLRLNVWTSVLVFLGALIYFLTVRGPQQFLVPVGGAPRAVPAGATAKGDVSQVDVSRPVRAGDHHPAPNGYHVVTEQQYAAYRETGQVPSGVASADGPDDPDEDGLRSDGDLLDDFADDESPDDGDAAGTDDAGDDDAAADGDAAGDDDAAARDDSAADGNGGDAGTRRGGGNEQARAGARADNR